MRVKITQPGWETYNGPLFGVMFVDAVSQAPLKPFQALQLGAMVSTVEVDEEGNELGVVNPAHELVKNASVTAEVVEPMKSDDAKRTEVASQTVEADIANEGEVTKVYTAEELKAIADEKGIGGLREIGDRLKVKNTSINGLIREIMNAQNPGAQV
jgi:hypothetical protein